MEEANLIPQEIIENFNKWAVDDVYTHWKQFAVEASIAAYDFAIARAQRESDRRLAKIREFIEDLTEYHELVVIGMVDEQELPVATPRQQKDMR